MKPTPETREQIREHIAQHLRERIANQPPPTGIRAVLAEKITPEMFAGIVAELPPDAQARIIAAMTAPAVRYITRKPRKS